MQVIPSPVFDPETGAGAAAPAATTSVEAPAAVGVSAGNGASSGSDFSGLAGDDYELDAASTLEGARAPVPPAVTPPAPQPALGTQPAVAVPATPQLAAQPQALQSTQEQTPQTQQAAPVEAGQQGPQNFDEVLTLFAQNEATLVDAIAASQFVLSPEEQTLLESDAISAVPKLLAKSYVKTMSGMMNMVKHHIPQMIQQQMMTMSRQQDAEKTFFSQFPALDRGKHGNEIARIGAALRQAYPTMPTNDLLTRIGQTVMAIHGIVGQQAPAQGQGAPPPATRTVQMTPFSPALPGGRPVQTLPVSDGNDFYTGLTADYDV